MHWEGVLIGLFSFFIIGLFHPIVIKAEYYWSKRSWPLFLLLGGGLLLGSLFAAGHVLSAVLGVAGFTSPWSIKELHEQEKRVQRGWFPKKPEAKDKRTENRTEEPGEQGGENRAG